MTMSRRRALAVALALMAVVGDVLVSGAAQAQAVAVGTLRISGDSQDTVTMGTSYAYSTSKGDVLGVTSENGSTVNIGVTSGDGTFWTLHFDAPGAPDQPVPGHSAVLVPGMYTAVREYPGKGTSPGMSVSGTRGCNTLTGSFTIIRAVFGRQGFVQHFDATFVQHCEGVTAAARGEVHISNPPPPPAPPPAPSPSSTTAIPYATPSAEESPTFEPSATGSRRGAALVGGGAAADIPPETARIFAARAWLLKAGLALVAVVILVTNVVVGVRSRRWRRTIRANQRRPAAPVTTVGEVIAPRSIDDSAEHRRLQYDPGPLVTRRSLPGKVIAVSVVVAARGVLGLLWTLALIGALRLRAVQELPLPSWYGNVLWLQVGVCAGEVVSGLLLLLGRQWPRMLGLSVLWFDVAAGTLIMSVTAFSCAGLVGIAVDAVLIWMFSWAEVRDWCS